MQLFFIEPGVALVELVRRYFLSVDPAGRLPSLKPNEAGVRVIPTCLWWGYWKESHSGPRGHVSVLFSTCLRGPFLLCWAWLHGVSCRSPRRVSGLSHGNKSTLVLGPLGKGLLDRDFSFRLCEDTDWLFDFGSKPGCRR